jgi:hypothetical protein
VNNSPSCYLGSGSFAYNAGADTCVNGNDSEGYLPSDFLHADNAHLPRILQFALKLIF